MAQLRGRGVRRARWRLTSRAFTDLGLWMAGLGASIGLVFPFVLVPLGIPSDLTLRPRFFVATLVAGMLLAGMNHFLARFVVGSRVRAMSRQMRHVTEVVADATYSGDWLRCSPEECRLVVDSDDELGESARSFNELIEALSASRAVQSAIATHSAELAHHLDTQEFASAALTSFRHMSGADAGAFGVVRDGDLHFLSAYRLELSELAEGAIGTAVDHGVPLWMEVPTGVVVDSSLLSFRPETTAVLPIQFRGVSVGVCVLAYGTAPEPNTVRLVEAATGITGVALNNAITHERFQLLAAVDPLTGAYNRRFGFGRLDEEWARSVRSSLPLGVLAFDLDHFKAVNDTYGHLVGDRVLRGAANAARLVIRDGDVLVRTGGEEFLVVLPGGGVDDVRAIGERIRRAVEGVRTAVGDAAVGVTVSIGAASLPHTSADSAEQLVAAADGALYAAKDAGRNRLSFAAAVAG